jgi:3-hydroxyacyl-CoA dehydrogenase
MTDGLESGSIACIGVGNVGRSWAIVFAQAGFTVKLYDADSEVIPKRALPAIKQSLVDLVSAGLLDDGESVFDRIHPVASLEQAVDGVVYVQESARENVQVKQEIFERLGHFAPADAILASSTSAIPGSQFMQPVQRPERCVIAHPVNPPHLIPLVEICASPWTSADTVERCYELMQRVGQQPIKVRKEIPGFILNRLQFTLVGEAMHLVGEGYCSPDDIDKVLKYGLAMRWAFIGPFEVAHLNATKGFEGFVDSLGHMMRALAQDAKVDYGWGPDLTNRIHAMLIEKTPVDKLPERQAWRDRRIMALRKHLQRAAEELDG